VEALSAQFTQALSNVNIDYTRGSGTQEEVRGVLEQSEKLLDWGIDTILIGSYSRQTGIHPTHDIDVFAKLTELDTAAKPSDVFDEVRRVLNEYYGSRAKPQNRSIKIDFGDGFSVDAVPAVTAGTRWAIPSRDQELWSGDRDKRWVETDPERLGLLTIERNRQPLVDGRGAYVPVVKLMRQTRRQHRGKAKPGGLYFELLTYQAFLEGITATTFAEIFALVLGRAAQQLASGLPVQDPAMLRPYSPAPESADLAASAQVFAGLATRAEETLVADQCKAAAIWREILGQNDRGSVFPVPPGCDESGDKVAITSASSRGPDEARGFA
jgi:hypothetical protein